MLGHLPGEETIETLQAVDAHLEAELWGVLAPSYPCSKVHPFPHFSELEVPIFCPFLIANAALTSSSNACSCPNLYAVTYQCDT